MVTPVPDVTRLVDRLVALGHVERSRDRQDRRVVRIKISETGIELLGQLDRPVDDRLRELLGHLGEERLRELIEALEQARRPLVDP